MFFLLQSQWTLLSLGSPLQIEMFSSRFLVRKELFKSEFDKKLFIWMKRFLSSFPPGPVSNRSELGPVRVWDHRLSAGVWSAPLPSQPASAAVTHPAAVLQPYNPLWAQNQVRKTNLFQYECWYSIWFSISLASIISLFPSWGILFSL